MSRETEIGQSIFEFAPEDIQRDQAINLRPFNGGDSVDGLDELMESIKAHGQIEPVVVRLDGEGNPHLIAGSRRVTAISLINAGLEEGMEPLKVKALVSLMDSDTDAWGMAWAENKDREDMSDMDIALNIGALRETRGWSGKAGTKQVGEYLGVSSAYVTTHEKLLGLPGGIQKKVHEGKLSMDAALKAAVAPAEVREEVITKASEIAEKEEAAAKEKAATTGKKAKTAKKGKGGSIVKGRHVTAAKRQVKGAEGSRPTPRSKHDLVQFIESEMLSPLFGYANGAVHKFGNCLLAWLKGEGTDKGLLAAFKGLESAADRGTPALEPVKKAQKAVKKVAVKVAPKAKAKAKPKK